MANDTEVEREKYLKVWENPQYRVVSPGLRHLAGALEWMKPEEGASITDWGSGSGQAADEMHRLGYQVRMVDIATNAYKGELPVIEACLWELPADLGPTDYSFCADVMEHLPPERVSEVFQAIAKRTGKKAYFQIALFHDNTFRHAGPLHLSVFPVEWWKEKVEAVFAKAEYQQIKTKHLLVVAGV